MVFETEVGDVIAESVQEVIMAVMGGAEESGGLFDRVFVVVPNFLRHIERGGAVGGNVEFYRWGLALIQRNNFEKLARDDRRIHQGIKRDGVELNLVPGLGSNRQRRPELPARGEPHGSCEAN